MRPGEGGGGVMTAPASNAPPPSGPSQRPLPASLREGAQALAGRRGKATVHPSQPPSRPAGVTAARSYAGVRHRCLEVRRTATEQSDLCARGTSGVRGGGEFGPPNVGALCTVGGHHGPWDTQRPLPTAPRGGLCGRVPKHSPDAGGKLRFIPHTPPPDLPVFGTHKIHERIALGYAPA